MKNYLVFAAIAAILILSAYSIYDSGEEDNSTINCWDGSQKCQPVELNSTVESCNDWYVDHPVDQLECETTQEGIEKVRIVTDPGNHVRGEYTSSKIEEKLISTGIEGQKDLEFLPSGNYVIGNNRGNIFILNDSGVRKKYAIGEASNLTVPDNSGWPVKGLAVDPNFEENRRIFVYYGIVTKIGGYSVQIDHRYHDARIDSFIIEEDGLKKENDIADIDGALWHSGGGIEIGPDNKLYVSVGDANEPSWAQNLDSKRGKILRLNLDGSVPDGNPFDNFIFSLGHRNPQGITWNPKNENMWSAEHGTNRMDEVNLIKKGKNYGWGRNICGETVNNSISISAGEVTGPERCFKNWTMAPSRMAFVQDSKHPWYGRMFLAGLRSKHLRSFEVENGNLGEERIFYVNRKSPNETGVSRRMRDIEYFNESLWVLGDHSSEQNSSGIMKLSPN